MLVRAASATPAAAPRDLRAAPVMAVPALLREFDLDPAPLLARAGIAPGLLDHPENRVPFEAVGRLLTDCARRTGCAHFGLLVGQRFDNATLGALGRLLRNCESVGSALFHLGQSFHTHDRGGLPVTFHLDARRVALGYAIVHPDMPGKSQVDDAAIAIAFNILRQLCGATWRPINVVFAHRAPADATPYRRLFGPQVRFDAELSAVVFSAHWLDRPIEGADPAVRDALLATFRQATAQDTGALEERVRRALYSLAYLDGPASAPAVARLFGLHERQLRRRLTQEGTSWRELAHEARCEAAKHLLRDTRLPLTEIAAALHYADASSLSRAFRLWTGVSPGVWRASNAPSAHEVGELPT